MDNSQVHYKPVQRGYIKVKPTLCGIDEQADKLKAKPHAGFVFTTSIYKEDVTCDWCLVQLEQSEEVTTKSEAKEYTDIAIQNGLVKLAHDFLNSPEVDAKLAAIVKKHSSSMEDVRVAAANAMRQVIREGGTHRALVTIAEEGAKLAGVGTVVNVEGGFDIHADSDRGELNDLIKSAMDEWHKADDENWEENEQEDDREWHRVNIHTALREHLELPGFRLRFKSLIKEALAESRRASYSGEDNRLKSIINSVLDEREARQRQSTPLRFDGDVRVHPSGGALSRVGGVMRNMEIIHLPDGPLRHARKIYTVSQPLCDRIITKDEVVIQSLGKRQLNTVTCPWCIKKMDIAQTEL